MQNLFKHLVFLLVFSFSIFANNLQVENISLTGQDVNNDYTMVQFDISWDNSWRDIINWDAAWVFAKYRVNNGDWVVAMLSINDGEHVAPTGSVINNGNNGGAYAPGVFIYRDANGAGSNDWNNVQLRWNYGDNGVADDDLVTVKIFAIEMVYVPQGTFELGDGSGGSTTNHFYLYNNNTFSVTIPIQGSLSIGQTVGLLWADGEIEAGTSNVNFPTGYNAFYCMKYETTQEQYVDFLNTLTRTQQNTRTYGTDISGTSVGGAVYILLGSSVMNHNQSIRCDEPLPAIGPVTFYCDRDGDGIRNEENDGQNIPCNYITWMDGCAYADWAGLRPMTELEFEKACRGDQPAVAGEYAWGNGNLNSTTYSVNNEGWYNSSIINQPTGTGNAIYNPSYLDRPLRVGIFAQSSTSRQEAGATYSGIMEMSGNLIEAVVTIGNADGRAFTGNHGGGGLNADGNANGVTSWPGWDGSAVTGQTGSGMRGGTCVLDFSILRLSDRTYAATDLGIGDSRGFRCVRTAP